jgi:hypothetical protein
MLILGMKLNAKSGVGVPDQRPGTYCAHMFNLSIKYSHLYARPGHETKCQIWATVNT